MTLDWLRECERIKRAVSIEDYRVGNFQGLIFHPVGFNKEEFKRYLVKIHSHKGEVTSSVDECDIIIIKNGVILTSNNYSYFERLNKEILTESWLESSCKIFELGDYRYQRNYLLNECEQLEKSVLDKKDSSKYQKLFNNHVFYISDDYSKEIKETLIRLISMGYGIYYNKLLPLTNYIICSSHKENYMKAYGKSFKPTLIVPNWLVDCIKFRKSLPTENYQPTVMDYNESNQIAKSEIVNRNFLSTIFKGKS